MEIKKLWQNVDTLKIHLYNSSLLEVLDIKFYNSLVLELSSIKKESQEKRNNFEDTKQFIKDFGIDKFQVMPNTVRGFSVSLKNSDVTIHLKKITNKIDNNPFCKIEFRSNFLHRFGYLKAIQHIIHFAKKNIIKAFEIKISEIHLHCDIQGYNFTFLDFLKFKTRTRKTAIYEDDSKSDTLFANCRDFTGFTLGTGDYMLRVYNKTKEIKQYPNKSFIKQFWLLNKNFDEDKDVFRIEFQLRREKLKKMVIGGIQLDGFSVILNNLNNIWKKCLDDFCFTNLSDDYSIDIIRGYYFDKNKNQIPLTKNTRNRRLDRANISKIWVFIGDFNGHHSTENITPFIKPYRQDFLYVNNAYKTFLSTFLSHYHQFNSENLNDSFDLVRKYTENKYKKSIYEYVLEKKLDRFCKLEIYYPEDIELMKSKEHFLQICEKSFNHNFKNLVFDDVNLSFFKKLQKVC